MTEQFKAFFKELDSPPSLLNLAALSKKTVQLLQLIEVIGVKVFPSNKRLKHRAELPESSVWFFAEVVKHCIDNRIPMHRFMVADSSYISLRAGPVK